MKYYVKCYECSRVFRINVQKYGRTRYRCPDCGNVVGFTLLQPAGKNGIAIPVVEAHPQAKPTQTLPKRGEAKLTQILPKGGDPKQSNDQSTKRPADQSTKRPDDQSTKRPDDQSRKRPGFWHRLWNAFCWLFGVMVKFLKWCNKKIRTFRERYEDADLWLFFGFSFLFVVGVIVGLWLMAQITILLSDVHSWFFQMFLKLKFML